jgi:hypothetical protein
MQKRTCQGSRDHARRDTRYKFSSFNIEWTWCEMFFINDRLMRTFMQTAQTGYTLSRIDRSIFDIDRFCWTCFFTDTAFLTAIEHYELQC